MPRKPGAARETPHRVSNSFSKDELEVLDVALQRVAAFRALPGGLTAADYEALMKVMRAALMGCDVTGLVRSSQVRRALTKLELLRGWADSELPLEGQSEASRVARQTVTERVRKMLERARLTDVIQAAPAEEAACG